MSDQPLWRPDPARSSQLSAFTREAEQASGRQFPDYQSLHHWSVEDPEAFWHLVWQFTDIIGSVPERPVLEQPDRFPGAQWFPGTRLNFAENLLKFRDDRPAILSVVETDSTEDPPQVLTYAELHRQVAAIAGYLRDQDVRPGDRVAGWLPNIPETIVAMLATASLGAVWTSCSPDFGAQGALDRFGQVRPKVLFVCDGYHYNGKTISIAEAVHQVVREVPDLAAVVWLDRINATPEDATHFEDLLVEEPVPLTFEPRRFDDPLYILYSSGTTGSPSASCTAPAAPCCST